MTETDYLAEKCSRVRHLLHELELDALALTSQANFAWLTSGADNHVGLATEAGNAVAVVTRDRAFVICDNIEWPRVLEEETVALGLDTIHYPWWEGGVEERITALVGSDNWAADSALGARPALDGRLAPLRAILNNQEIESYRQLGRFTAMALEMAASRLEAGQTEEEAAGMIAGLIVSKGVYPGVILVASDQRLEKYRHPIPKAKRIEKTCMLVVGARWRGLVASATRIVSFGQPPAGMLERHRAVCTVDAAFLAATIPGETVGDAFRAGLEAYREAGYPDEWMMHHQGGPTGYKAREYRALSQSKDVIQLNQAFAWNPSIAGTKSEDTVLAREPFPEVLTVSEDWPAIEVESAAGVVRRPDILVK